MTNSLSEAIREIVAQRFSDPVLAQAAEEVVQQVLVLCDLPDLGVGGVKITSFSLPNMVRIERAPRKGADDRWAVRFFGDCLSTTGEWNEELSPSSLTDDWLENHRFTTASEAVAAAVRAQGREAELWPAPKP